MYAQMLGFASWVTGSRSSAARLTPKLITGLKPAAPVGENRPNTSPAAVTRAIRIRTRIRLLLLRFDCTPGYAPGRSSPCVTLLPRPGCPRQPWVAGVAQEGAAKT